MTALEWSNRLSSGSMSSMSSTGEYTFTDLNGEACSPDFATYARACGADGYGAPNTYIRLAAQAVAQRRSS